MVRPVVGGGEVAVDEIADFADVRSVGASEATWRIFGFEMGDRAPDVIGLPVHLEDMQDTQFSAANVADVVAAGPPATKLTEWFKLNGRCRDAGEVPPPRESEMTDGRRTSRAIAWSTTHSMPAATSASVLEPVQSRTCTAMSSAWLAAP